ncbi:MAG: O-methyltransferase [Planctomycetota bacterium JB042]
MFHSIPPRMIDRMRTLEALDAEQRREQAPRLERLCQVPAETGRFLALTAAAAPPGGIVEVGTSGGYSTLWFSLAAAATGRSIRTYERLPHKVEIARETFALAGVEDRVELIEGDALDGLAGERDVGFCFLDGEKGEYARAYELALETLVPGGLLVADNVTSHRTILEPFVEAVLRDERVDAVSLPIGKGELVCRKR